MTVLPIMPATAFGQWKGRPPIIHINDFAKANYLLEEKLLNYMKIQGVPISPIPRGLFQIAANRLLFTTMVWPNSDFAYIPNSQGSKACIYYIKVDDWLEIPLEHTPIQVTLKNPRASQNGR